MMLNYTIVSKASAVYLKENFNKVGKSRGRGYGGAEEGLQNQGQEGKGKVGGHSERGRIMGLRMRKLGEKTA